MKKLLGILLIVAAVIISTSMLFQIGNLITSFLETANGDPHTFQWEYFSGQVIGAVLFILLIYLLFRWGYKLVKTSVDTKNSISP